MTFEEFSGGYYRAEMDVQPYDDGPVIEHELYEHIDNEIYGSSNAPITMQVGLDKGPYFHVDSEAAVPTDVLALPDGLIDGAGRQDVFVLKPRHSYLLNRSRVLQERFGDANERSE